MTGHPLGQQNSAAAASALGVPRAYGQLLAVASVVESYQRAVSSGRFKRSYGERLIHFRHAQGATRSITTGYVDALPRAILG